MNKKYIIIGLLIVVVVFLVSLIAFSLMSTSHAYKNFTCNDTGTTFEVPVDLKVRQDSAVEGIRSTIMSTPDGNIIIERQVGDNPYIDDTLEGASNLLNSYDGDKVNGVEIHTCSKTVKNEATGEVILVTSNTGDNETVEHIINSIKWGNKSTIASDNTTSTVSSTTTSSSSSEPHYDAYCQYCGKGIIWPSQGEQWYICDDCMKTHEKENNERLEAESVDNYDDSDYDDSDYEDDEESLV